MSDIWSIQRQDGTVKTFAEYGILSAVRTLYNQDVDTVVISFGFGDLLSDTFWLYKEWITVLRCGVAWFQGYRDADNPAADEAKESHTVTLSGPWKQLVRLTYQQLSAWVSATVNTILLASQLPYPPLVNGILQQLTSEQIAANDAFIQTPEAYPHYVAMTSVILLYSTLTGDTWETDAMISAVLTYAISQGVQLQIGTLAAGITVPMETIMDKSCAEIIKRILTWQPDVGVWIDYSTTPPTFNTIQRASRTPLNLTSGVDDITKVGFNPLYDLWISGVTLNYIEPQTNTGYTFYTLSQDMAGPSPGGIGAMIATLQLLGGTVYDQTQTVYENGQPIPTGLAAYLFACYGTLQYAGSGDVSRDDCPAGTAMASSLNVIGLRPEWAGFLAVIQSQKDDIFSGKTSYTVGAPTQLTAANLAALVQARANYQPVGTLGQSRYTGGVSTPNIQPPSQPPGYSGPAGTVDPDVPGLPTGPYDSYEPDAVCTITSTSGGSVTIGRGITTPAVPITNSALPAIPSQPDTPIADIGFASFDAYTLQQEDNGGNSHSTEQDRSTAITYFSYNLGIAGWVPGARVYLVGTQTITTGAGSTSTAYTVTKAGFQQLATSTGSGTGDDRGNLGAEYTWQGDAYSYGSASGSVTYTEVRVYPPTALALP